MLLCSLWISSLEAEELRDPTRPFNWTPPVLSPEQAVSAKPTWSVSLILVSPRRRTAIVNGQLVQVGDKVKNAQVVAITTKAVIMRLGKQRLTLPITKIQVKVSTRPVR